MGTPGGEVALREDADHELQDGRSQRQQRTSHGHGWTLGEDLFDRQRSGHGFLHVAALRPETPVSRGLHGHAVSSDLVGSNRASKFSSAQAPCAENLWLFSGAWWGPLIP